MKYLHYQHDFLTQIADIKNLLIVVAMEPEEDALLKGLRVTEIKLGKRFPLIAKKFSLPKAEITVARSGIGLVNAGVLLAMIQEHQEVDAVILLGVGGALDEKLEVGDAVLAHQILQHDSISSLETGNIFIAPGELALSVDQEQQVDPFMRCDSRLVDWMYDSLRESHSGEVYRATIVSGSEFVGSIERKRTLRALVEDSILVDMEAAALAQVARKLRIPFVAAKTVADRARPESSIADDYSNFLSAAAAHSATLLQTLLKTFG